MYLIDTNVLSELRKGRKANSAVLAFFAEVDPAGLYLSVQTIGELRSGIARLRLRGDGPQAQTLENWVGRLLEEYGERVLAFDADCAQVWGQLMAGSGQNLIDKQIAAIALINSLTVVTRNSRDFTGTGVTVRNPFGDLSGAA